MYHINTIHDKVVG